MTQLKGVVQQSRAVKIAETGPTHPKPVAVAMMMMAATSPTTKMTLMMIRKKTTRPKRKQKKAMQMRKRTTRRKIRKKQRRIRNRALVVRTQCLHGWRQVEVAAARRIAVQMLTIVSVLLLIRQNPRMTNVTIANKRTEKCTDNTNAKLLMTQYYLLAEITRLFFAVDDTDAHIY